MGIFCWLFGRKNAPSPAPAGAPPQAPPSGGENDWQSAGGVPQELAASEVLELQNSGQPPLLLDVREAEERQAEGVIPGSLHLPMGELEGRFGELDPARPVIVYCATGMRSMDAGAFLIEKGFRDVSNLNGGLSAWTGPRETPPPS